MNLGSKKRAGTFTINISLEIILTLVGPTQSAIVGAALKVRLLQWNACGSVSELAKVEPNAAEGMTLALGIAPFAAIG